MTPGMYMIVDMGAGTTELSVNHVDERGADQKVLCYHDESVVIGGDNFEWADSQGPQGEAETKQLIKAFRRVFATTWHTGYMKDRPNPAAHGRWRNFRVLLAGGAARRREVERAIVDRRPFSNFPVAEERYDVAWHCPTDVILDKSVGESGDQLALLAVAHGLSVPRQQWPEFFPPAEVEQQKDAEVVDMPPAYWYLER
jgi:hypothetical protein